MDTDVYMAVRTMLYLPIAPDPASQKIKTYLSTLSEHVLAGVPAIELSEDIKNAAGRVYGQPKFVELT
jgi:hypothetical protein